MLTFSPEPRAFIRAALLYLREGVEISPQGQENLLFALAREDADEPQVIRRFEAAAAQERWGKALAHGELIKLLFFNIRHQKPGWPLMIQGIQEVLARGPNYLLNGAGPGGHALIERKNAVSKEIHRLVGFTRLTPAPDGVLVGQAPAKHYTGDLVALGLARRNPGQPLALLTPTGNWFCLGCRLSPISGKQYQGVKDDFDTTWLEYYQSQFIPERNNPRHAAKAIPQELWQWLAEGEIMRQNKK